MGTKLLIDFMVIAGLALFISSLTLLIYWGVRVLYWVVGVIGFIKERILKRVELEKRGTQIHLISDNDNNKIVNKDVNKYAGNAIRVGGNSNNSDPVVDRKNKKAKILIPENLNEYEKELLRQFYDL